MKTPLPKLNELQNGRSHYGDMQCYGHTKILSDSVGSWQSAEEIQHDNRWTKSAVNEDGYLLWKFDRLINEKPVFLDSISVVYYGRGACSNKDNEYEKLLNIDELFVYPNLTEKL